MSLRTTMLCTAVTLLSLSGLVLAGTPTTAHAQGAQRAGRGQRGGNPLNGIENAFKAITPTTEEQTKFDALVAKYKTDSQGVQGPERATLSAKLREDVLAILTPEQQTKFKDEIARAGAPALVNQLDRELTLTADEKAKIEPVVGNYLQNVAAIRADASLQGAARREKQTGLVTEMKGKIRALLTAEQQTKFDAMTFPPAGRGGNRRGGGAAPAAPAPAAPGTAKP